MIFQLPSPSISGGESRSSRWWQRYAPVVTNDPIDYKLKLLIWSYWLLWFAEGALRKWIFPAYSAPLVIVRDPVAVLIITCALIFGRWSIDLKTVILYILGLIAFAVTLANGVPVLVDLVGLRTLCLHFPIIFIMGRILEREDVERMGNLAVDLALPMSLIMIVQFMSPAGALVNAGAGIGAEQIGGVGEGRIRAPGVFSFISGAAQYYSLAAAYVCARFSQRRYKANFLVGLSLLGIVLAMSVAVSRSLAGGVMVVSIVFVVASLFIRISASRLALLMLATGVIGIIFVKSSVTAEGFQALKDRAFAANDSEGSIVTRFLSGFLIDSDTIEKAGLTGKGLGVGTNMGSQLLTGGVDFLLAEGEWPRVVLEMGAVLGITFIIWRIVVFGQLAASSLRAIGRKDILPALLLAAGGLSLLNGQSGQPATLGYIILANGLALAAAKSHRAFVLQKGLLYRVPRKGANRRHVLSSDSKPTTG